MNRFKVGDRVKIKDKSGTGFNVGDVATIIGVSRQGIYQCRRDQEEIYSQFFPADALELIADPNPEPEITVRGHTYRLVEPEAPEPEAGQIWVEEDTYILVLEAESNGGLDAVELTRSYPGMILHNRFNGKAPRPTFVANSLREALESGKLKVSDL